MFTHAVFSKTTFLASNFKLNARVGGLHCTVFVPSLTLFVPYFNLIIVLFLVLQLSNLAVLNFFVR